MGAKHIYMQYSDHGANKCGVNEIIVLRNITNKYSDTFMTHINHMQPMNCKLDGLWFKPK